MAITLQDKTVKLGVGYVNGFTASGTLKVKYQKFGNINPAATDLQLLNLAHQIGQVLIAEPSDVKKYEEYSMVQG